MHNGGATAERSFKDELAQVRDDTARPYTKVKPRLHSETQRATAAA